MKNIVIVAYAIAGFDWLVASMIRQGSRTHQALSASSWICCRGAPVARPKADTTNVESADRNFWRAVMLRYVWNSFVADRLVRSLKSRMKIDEYASKAEYSSLGKQLVEIQEVIKK